VIYDLGRPNVLLLENISTMAKYDWDKESVKIEDVFKLVLFMRKDRIQTKQLLTVFLIQFVMDYKLAQEVTSEFWNTIMNVIYIATNNVHCKKFECIEIDYEMDIRDK